MPNLRTMTDTEILRHAYATRDALVTTELKLELQQRFQTRITAEADGSAELETAIAKLREELDTANSEIADRQDTIEALRKDLEDAQPLV